MWFPENKIFCFKAVSEGHCIQYELFCFQKFCSCHLEPLVTRYLFLMLAYACQIPTGGHRNPSQTWLETAQATRLCIRFTITVDRFSRIQFELCNYHAVWGFQCERSHALGNDTLMMSIQRFAGGVISHVKSFHVQVLYRDEKRMQDHWYGWHLRDAWNYADYSCLFSMCKQWCCQMNIHLLRTSLPCGCEVQ